MRFKIAFCLIILTIGTNGQSNPGFLGMKHTVGAHIQFTPFFKGKNYLTGHIRAEQTLKRNLALEASIGLFSNTFNPKLGDDNMIFSEPNNNQSWQNQFYANNLIGTVKFKGTHIQLGTVFYLKKFGSMAPYGKRFSVGLFYNSAKIMEENIGYELLLQRNSGYETFYYVPVPKPYDARSIIGTYAEVGEKRILNKNLFFQYSLQFNVPLVFNYTYNDLAFQDYYNNQDFLEHKMKQVVVRNNLLSAYLGIGLLLK
jgi:hypothetical protein